MLEIGIQMRLRPDLFLSALHKLRFPEELWEALKRRPIECERVEMKDIKNQGILAINGMALSLIHI